MNATTSTHESVSDDARRIGQDRLERALTQDMQIDATLPRQFAVTHDGRTFDVDIQQGTCQCEDHQYRGDSVVCKHVLSACVYGVFTDGVRTRLQARVVAATRDVGCPHGHTSIHGGACAGPLGRGVFPCPECVAATPGSWSAWKFLVEDEHVTPDASADADAGSQEPEIVADGGREPHERAPLTADCDDCRFAAERLTLASADHAATKHQGQADHSVTIRGSDGSRLEDGRFVDGENDGDGSGDENTIINDHGDEVPARSEPADFGGGETNGVEEL